jgi:hypothetical protein
MIDFEILTEEKKQEIANLERNLAQVSSALFSAIMTIHNFEPLIINHHRDKFGACVHCKKHLKFGCADDCAFQLARRTFAEFQKRFQVTPK